MRVRCRRIIVAPYPKEVDEHVGIHIGGEYVVLEINAGPGGELSLPPFVRIIDDSGEPSFWFSTMFEMVSTRIPSNWTASIGEDGGIDIGVQSWLTAFSGVFWDRYFEGSREARQLYKREVQTVIDEA